MALKDSVEPGTVARASANKGRNNITLYANEEDAAILHMCIVAEDIPDPEMDM
jgi:hypothetical protein